MCGVKYKRNVQIVNSLTEVAFHRQCRNSATVRDENREVANEVIYRKGMNPINLVSSATSQKSLNMLKRVCSRSRMIINARIVPLFYRIIFKKPYVHKFSFIRSVSVSRSLFGSVSEPA